MTHLLDDARRLAAIDPFVNVWAHSSGEYECFACEAPWSGEGKQHKPDCPWLALPRIIAALEAAESVSEAYDRETVATWGHSLGSPLLAAVDRLDGTLRGEPA